MSWIAAMPVTARAVCSSKIHVLKPVFKCTGYLRAKELYMVSTLRWTGGVQDWAAIQYAS
jgi:hypothetical protein